MPTLGEPPLMPDYNIVGINPGQASSMTAAIDNYVVNLKKVINEYDESTILSTNASQSLAGAGYNNLDKLNVAILDAADIVYAELSKLSKKLTDIAASYKNASSSATISYDEAAKKLKS